MPIRQSQTDAVRCGPAALSLCLGLAAALASTSLEAASPQASVEVVGSPEIIYDSTRDQCAPIDVPDVDARAFKDASGQVVMFALHFVNRPLRGPDIGHLKIDCHVALDSRFDPDPADYADRNFIAALWTDDGRRISALVHHEYHADAHKTCRVASELGCWYNTILAFESHDGGADFVKSRPAFVAGAPFRQEVGQGRHRGFFNPSNIVSDGGYKYVFMSTTGWTGQPFGACLFRSPNPADPATWRAYDGHDFTIRFHDPYAAGSAQEPKPCAVIAPFVLPLGGVVRERRSGLWIAVFQAARDTGAFPVAGFYYAVGRDLLHWGTPKLLMAGNGFGDLCKLGPSIMSYPALLDETAQTRNFEDVGASPYLYYAVMKIENCATTERFLVRRRLSISYEGEARR